MINEVSTEFGKITYGEDIIISIIEESVNSLDERIWLGNPSIKRLQMNNQENSLIEVTKDDDNLSVIVYVIIKFGSSISEITRNLILDIRLRLEKSLNLKDFDLKIIVTGVQTRTQIAPRYIEVV